MHISFKSFSMSIYSSHKIYNIVWIFFFFLHFLLCQKCFPGYSRCAYFSTILIIAGKYWGSMPWYYIIQMLSWIFSFYLHNNKIDTIIFLIVFPFFRWGHCNTERLSNLSEVTPPKVPFWLQWWALPTMFYCQVEVTLSFSGYWIFSSLPVK